MEPDSPYGGKGNKMVRIACELYRNLGVLLHLDSGAVITAVLHDTDVLADGSCPPSPSKAFMVVSSSED